MLFQDSCNEESRIVPITGLTPEMQTLLVGIIFPLILSIIIAIIFPRIFAPLFLKAKSKFLAPAYKNGYLDRTSTPMAKKFIIKRMIYSILMMLGFLSVISTLLNPEDWLSPEKVCSNAERGITNFNDFDFLIPLSGLVFPLGIALWSVSWALEDSCLMHYVFKEDGFYEIEPIHVKYTSYIKGYASISGLLFLITYTYDRVILMIGEDNSLVGEAMLILVPIVIAIGCFIPTYLIYSKMMKNPTFLRKGMDAIKQLNEDDIKK